MCRFTRRHSSLPSTLYICNTFLTAGTTSKHSLLTSLSPRDLSVSENCPRSQCQEECSKDSNDDDVVFVVLAVACEIETERCVDDTEDKKTDSENHVDLSNDGVLAATEEKMMQKTA